MYQLYRRSAADNTGELTDTTLIASLKGGVSGGTAHTARAMMEAIAADPSRGRVLSHPYSLSPDKSMDPDVGRQTDQAFERASAIDASLDGWVSTFVMAQHNTKVVRRSNGLLGWMYGKKFRYREVMSAGSSPLAPLIAAGVSGGIVAVMVIGALLSHVSPGRWLLDRALPKPGTGPSEKTRRAGWFAMKTFAKTTSGAKYMCTFEGQGDPGLPGHCGDARRSGPVPGPRRPAGGGGHSDSGLVYGRRAQRLRKAGVTIEVARA